MHIIYAADSRGHGLHNFISRNDTRLSITNHFLIQSGATVGYLQFHIQKLVHRIRKDSNLKDTVVFLAAGINNLTTKKKCGKIVYDRTYNNKEHLLLELLNFHNILTRQNIKVIIATIAPANIQKYNNYKGRIYNHEEEHEQQHTLESDIREVNCFIQELNNETETSTVHLAKDLNKIETKRTGRKKRKVKVSRFRYKQFYDGLHPDRHLKVKWFRVILNSCMQETEISVDKEDSDSEDIEGDSNLWDFKRALHVM